MKLQFLGKRALKAYIYQKMTLLPVVSNTNWECGTAIK